MLFYPKCWFWIIPRAEIISLLLRNLSDICASKLCHGISTSLPLALPCQTQWSEHTKMKKHSFSKGQNEIYFTFAPVCSILHNKKAPLPVHDTKINLDFLRISQQFTGELPAIWPFSCLASCLTMSIWPLMCICAFDAIACPCHRGQTRATGTARLAGDSACAGFSRRSSSLHDHLNWTKVELLRRTFFFVWQNFLSCWAFRGGLRPHLLGLTLLFIGSERPLSSNCFFFSEHDLQIIP